MPKAVFKRQHRRDVLHDECRISGNMFAHVTGNQPGIKIEPASGTKANNNIDALPSKKFIARAMAIGENPIIEAVIKIKRMRPRARAVKQQKRLECIRLLVSAVLVMSGFVPHHLVVFLSYHVEPLPSGR